MSEPHDEKPVHCAEPPDGKVLFSALGWLGVLGLFGLIVYVTYVRQGPNPVDPAHADRARIRASVEAEQTRLATSYEWVDRSKGIVRIPIDRAKQLVLADLKKAPEASR